MLTLIILLGVLAFLAAILLLPVRVEISCVKNDEVNKLGVKAGLGPVMLTVLPSKKKEAPEIKGEEPGVQLGSFKKVFGAVVDAVSFMKKRLVFSYLRLNMRLGTGDAAGTALLAGAAGAFFYNIASVCDNYFVLKDKDIEVTPDFEDKVFQVDFKCAAKLRVIYAVIILIKLFSSLNERKGRKK